MAKNKSKKRKLHANHAEHRKPAKPPQRKDILKSQSQSQSKSSSQKVVSKKPPQQPTIPFHPEHRILLIGDGDFSFAHSIVEHHGCCDVTATAYDSREALFAKYHPQAADHVSYLEAEGQSVLCHVDATTLDTNKVLTKVAAAEGTFDVVIFNFPHVGGKSTDVNRQVRFNQELLVKFFQTVQSVLAWNGSVVVTLFEGEPYTLWNIRDLGRHAGLEVERSFKFQADVYPGYSHARTLGNIDGGGGWKGEDREARSYVFRMKGGGKDGSGANEAPKTQAEMQKAMERQRRERMGAGDKRKRARDEESDSDED